MVRNLHHIKDLEPGIPYDKKKKALQLWQHSKLRSNAGNLSVHVGFAEFLYNA